MIVFIDTGSKQEILCETCLQLCFIDAQLPVKNIGVFRVNQTVSYEQKTNKKEKKEFFLKQIKRFAQHSSIKRLTFLCNLIKKNNVMHTTNQNIIFSLITE